MHLIWATDDYLLSGRSLAGFPILLNDLMETCHPANDFFRYYLLRGAIDSGHSYKAVGQALYDYFSFLQAHNLDWREIERGEAKGLLSAYRDYCYREHSHGRNTVRLRLQYISKFYIYAQKKGLIHELPFEFNSVTTRKRKNLLTHLDTRDNQVWVNDAIPKKHKDLPKYLTRDSVRALINTTQNIHYRTFIRFALQSGLRRMELATFPIAYIQRALATPNNHRMQMIRLSPTDGHGIKTKGSKPRKLWVSRELLLDLNRYIVHHRGQRARNAEIDSGRLFLNHNGDPYANEGKAFEKIVRDIGRKIGLDVHPHMLRHTYATHTLVSLQRSTARLDPLVFVSRQLGHSSIQTTEIYLHLLDDYVDNAVIEYDEELNKLGSSDA